MGANQSQSSSPAIEEKFVAATNSSQKPLSATEALARLSLRNSKKAPPTAAITLSAISEWETKFTSDPKAQFASTVLHKTEMLGALVQRKAVIADQQVFNVKLSSEGTPVTNQKSSGRCWLFATTNCIRIAMARKYDLPEFELSQSYLFFYDALSKANYALENMLDLADEPLDSRVIQYLLEAPLNDGGQWDMAVNLIEAYGLVPQCIYPESFHSSNTSRVKTFLTSKVREYTLELRQLYSSTMNALDESSGEAMTFAAKREIALISARRRKEEQMEDVYRVLAITLGAPPKPNDTFVWEYYTTAKVYKRITSTPLSFYKDYSTVDVASAISLIHDPRNQPGLYTVQRLGNVWGGRPVLYVNTKIDNLKEVAIALLKADVPVWFGCDVGKSSSSALGLMDTDLFDMDGAFGTSVGLSKTQRLETGDSALTHAMTLTAVHLNDAGKPIRWRVENSWSASAGDKGFFLMSDKWFSEYVLQIVADRKRVPKHLVKVFEEGTPIELPPWDAMGSLAWS